MIIAILVVLLSLVILTALHELGHFLLAKKFDVKVEEFGIGYPPRIIGKKIGETIYSLNLLPFGAFVKIMGEDGGVDDQRSFAKKTILQRALILLGGVVMFWIVAIIILTFLSGIAGVPTAVPDNLDTKANVQILSIASDSPAQKAGIQVGDIIMKVGEESVDKVQQVQDFTKIHEQEEITLFLQRAGEEVNTKLTLRESNHAQGSIGVSLVRVSNLKTTWYKAPFLASKITYEQTKAIPVVLYGALRKKIGGEKVTEVQFVGPIGVGQMLGRAVYQSWGSFFMLISMISIWLALFNILPIPALDGGRLLFLIIEAIRRKPMTQKIEQKINGFFFLILIVFMVFITARDIFRLF